MICHACHYINPSDNAYCQHCGVKLFEIVTHTEEPSPTKPMGRRANTVDNISLRITRSAWSLRWNLWLPFLVLAALSWWRWHWVWLASGIATAGLVWALYKVRSIHRIIDQSIPVELIGKQIIAYGPANTQGVFRAPRGVLYLLSEGLYYKSFSNTDEYAFVHVNRRIALTAKRVGGMGLLSDWDRFRITYDSGESITFTVFGAQTWTFLIALVCDERSGVATHLH